ncbi:DUF3899 domain-containing protein [Virgibacillus halophilus]|uniref:DUF3899 domain-containing protein n=1 Tax=Tigheibacillus halophilus TaxID=361280 RepID=UPI0036320941
MKKNIIWIVSSQAFILLLCKVVYNNFHLLSYINISFTVSILLILISLGGIVTKARFFDIVFYSFQSFFSGMKNRGREPLSKLIPQNYDVPLITGAVDLCLMSAALVLYYA